MVLLLASSVGVMAQNAPPKVEVIAAPPEPRAIPLYGDAAPGAANSENWSLFDNKHYVVRNVTRPTLTAYLPDPAKATGAAVVVAPGGAFMLLAIGPEGWDVAKRLNDRGIAAFVLKYRVMPTPVGEAEASAFMNEKVKKGLPNPKKQPTLQYAPSTSLNTVVAAKPGQGPDFFGYIYGPQAKTKVPEKAPPMFAAIAFDDPLFPTIGFPLVEAWKAAKRPVELHAYERGGHGFGLGVPETTTTGMIDQFVSWMDMQGFTQRELNK
jgi:acetyl esterase/lipase